MKYKALFLDLDGTTVANGPNTVPSVRVTQAIAALKGKLTVSIATGRPLYAAKNVLDHLDITGLCVLNNGVQLYDPVKKKVLKEIIISQSAIPQIVEVAHAFKLKPFLFDGTSDNEMKIGDTSKPAQSIFFPEVSKKKVDKFTRALSTISDIATHVGTAWTGEQNVFVDVTNSLASKQHGIVEICKKLQIESHEIIGVGDSYNDFPLLLACGLKFAMGNGAPELQDIADFVAPSVDDDGVAVIIEKFILPMFE